MKITLKDLLGCEGVESPTVSTSLGKPFISCQNCGRLYEIGILIVHEGEIEVWCRHCVEESN